jgi:hypothetical protein
MISVAVLQRSRTTDCDEVILPFGNKKATNYTWDMVVAALADGLSVVLWFCTDPICHPPPRLEPQARRPIVCSPSVQVHLFRNRLEVQPSVAHDTQVCYAWLL